MTAPEMNLLLKQAQKGDDTAFAKIYTQYYQFVHYLAFRLLQNEEDASDIVQETMVRIYQNLKRMNHAGSLHEYMRKTATNCAIDLLRKRRGDAQQIDEIAEVLPDDNENIIPESFLHKKEKRQWIISCIDQLNELERVPIVLFYFEQYSQKEIAKFLGEKENTIKQRINRGKQRLKKQIQTCYGEEVGRI